MINSAITFNVNYFAYNYSIKKADLSMSEMTHNYEVNSSAQITWSTKAGISKMVNKMFSAT